MDGWAPPGGGALLTERAPRWLCSLRHIMISASTERALRRSPSSTAAAEELRGALEAARAAEEPQRAAEEPQRGY